MLRIKLVALSTLMTLARSPFATSAAQSFAKSNPIRSNQLAKPRKHVECPCHRGDALRARSSSYLSLRQRAFGVMFGTDDRLRDPYEMWMVGEKEVLGGLRSFSQHLEPRLRTFVVEVHEEVVGQERQDAAGGDGLFQGSQPQGEEELVGRNLAHGSNFDHRAPIVPHAEQPRSGTIGVDLKSYEAVRR